MSRYSEIAANLAAVQSRIATAAQAVGRATEEIQLIVVTKNFPLSDVEILYELGIRNFGENRDQEGATKSAELSGDVRWHFQGQIQSRKIKSIGSWAEVIHSLDSLDHARKFASLTQSRPREFFVQVNLEPARVDRGGVPLASLPQFLSDLNAESGISPNGLMTVAPVDAPAREAFSTLKEAQRQLINDFPALTNLSMGMSGDFEEAIYEGATHIRVGSSILGSRGLPA